MININVHVNKIVTNPPKETKLDKLMRLYRQTLEDKNYYKSAQALYLINRLKQNEITNLVNNFEYYISYQNIKNNYLNLIK